MKQNAQSKHFCGLVISTFLSRLSAEGAVCRGWAGGILFRTILRHLGDEVTLGLDIQGGGSLVVAIGTPDPRGRCGYGLVLQWKVFSSCLHTLAAPIESHSDRGKCTWHFFL